MNNFLENHVFLRSFDISHCLETGAGSHSYLYNFLNKYSFSLSLLDISEVNLNKLDSSIGDNKNVSFIHEDACKYINDNKYDLIVDSHLYHCLTTDENRKQYLQNIHRSLKVGGTFVMETMVSHSSMSFDHDLSFDLSSGVLSLGKQNIRMIKETREIERELLNSGLQITYLRCFEDLKLIAHPYRDTANSFDPDILRIICQKTE